MEVNLHAHGVCESIVPGDRSIDEAKRYNWKAINVILNVFPNSVKTKVGQCSIAKALWEKLHNLYSTKKSGQDVIENSNPSEYAEEGLTIEEFSKEAIKLIKELKAKKIHSNTLEEQFQGLKIEVEEHKYN